MITGAHVILYSSDADAGGGWLILALPPGEVAVHPTDGPPKHELYLLCDDAELVADVIAGSGT